MKKHKYLIFGLSIVIILILALLIYVNYFEEKIIFTLFGDHEITLYEGLEYNEYGFLALSDTGTNVTKDVLVNSNLDVNTIGDYEIEYSIRTGIKKYKAIRTIHVVEDKLKEVEFSLKGTAIVNLKVGNSYKDARFVCKHRITGEDLTKYVSIENSVNNKKPGIYEIVYRLTYKGKSKTLSRKVYVFEQTNAYSLSTTSLTNKPISIKFQSYIYNFSYVICPNENIVYDSTFTYNIFENGKYTFYVFDTMKNYEVYTITINNIDKISPTGTCKVTLASGKTSYTVKTKDTDILKYVYDNKEKHARTTKTYTANTYLRNDVVLLVDRAGNKTMIKCDAKRTYLPVIKPKKGSNIVYTANSDSLVFNIAYQDGYYLTNIWMKDAYLQMKKEMVYEYSKSLMLPKNILEKAVSKNKLSNKIVLGGNASASVLKGSYYSNIARTDSRYNLKEPSSLLVYNGKVLINDYKKYAANTVIYYINGRNELSYIPPMEKQSVKEREVIFNEALNIGVYNTYAFNAMLVVNSKAQKVSNDYYALRNSFCQLDENNYIWVVSKTKKWNKPDFAKYMQSLGCKTAVNFDGGGSVALIYKPKNSTKLNVLSGNGRKLASAMYLTELN